MDTSRAQLSAATPPSRTSDATWIAPFFLVLASALAFFLWEMARYTSLMS
jgi:hypothetical protein